MPIIKYLSESYILPKIDRASTEIVLLNIETPCSPGGDQGFELVALSEEVGFEPTVGCPTTVFKTAAIGHSATLPLSKAL